MTEYWISKKQYWCKYCSIWIRDDVPSRRQHETGLKHIGNKERFIRELYRGGEKAKKEKAQEAAEMARINAAIEVAQAAYANDLAAGDARPPPPALSASSSMPSTSSRPKPRDKWSNYTTAAQLGFVDPDVEKTSYEIEQEIKCGAGEPGQWEEVVDPLPVSAEDSDNVLIGEKRAREEDEEGEGWKFEHKGKKPVYDPYDDDWDPSALKSLKVKKKEGNTEVGEVKTETVVTFAPELQLQREGWSGKLEFKPVKKEEKEKVFMPGGGWVKVDNKQDNEEGEKPSVVKVDPSSEDRSEDKPDVILDVKPDIKGVNSVPPAPEPEASASSSGGGMFKKRRPPPSSRKK